MHPQPLGIEVVTVTAEQIGVAFLVWVAVISLAYWLGVVTGVWGQQAGPPEGSGSVDVDGGDPDATGEIPPPAPRRRRPPCTGTVHEPCRPVVPGDDATVVIGYPDEVPR